MKLTCCKPRVEEKMIDQIERLESTICALDVKCKAIHYQMAEALLKAKFFKQNGDPVRCKAELKRKFDLSKTYERFVNFHSNVVKIRNAIDETQAIGEVVGNMNIANKIFEEALKNVNPEKIDELMDSLEDNIIKVNDVSSSLSKGVGGGDFDEEAAMRELEEEEEEEELNLPNVKRKELLME
jgi:hypothetical protein